MSKPRWRVRDGLALARALPDRSIVAMVTAMSLLAALTWAGAFGAQSLSARWAGGAENLVTVQVPDPEKPASSLSNNQLSRIDAVIDALRTEPECSAIHRLDAQELDRLLKPWLGTEGAAALALPGVIEIHLAPDTSLPKTFSSRLTSLAPGTLIEQNDDWRKRLLVVARSLLGCAALAIALVGGISAAVIGMATRMGLGARRESIMILHGLGAADGYVASRFGRRVAWLSLVGGMAGTTLALPPIVIIARFMAPLSGPQTVMTPEAGGIATVSQIFTSFGNGDVPAGLMTGLACIPLIAMMTGWLTAQVIVRVWLRRLP
ncbi:cell division protein FtsX [Acetobacter oeni]|uniref:Cell division protein FtsX n=1 Tax=Acetobacter oeni TaxID=304077 RepID=A0A511XGI0_9PROT|nr:cell division protein FtsX [Acetobacter oeni]MBB3881774.1 cell division transport system permease protein [Acetobacter oeni]NHO17424.1 cell division protein FtsX [Acetobacter oeni]GBR02014.1 cell division protein FtsX [Acetobacter oeni LMG 21952]GEN62053.1 hypothetical protein AOE01nite_02770 [Acetobacter oeni]